MIYEDIEIFDLDEFLVELVLEGPSGDLCELGFDVSHTCDSLRIDASVVVLFQVAVGHQSAKRSRSKRSMSLVIILLML